jgi:hypothetical protein
MGGRGRIRLFGSLSVWRVRAGVGRDGWARRAGGRGTLLHRSPRSRARDDALEIVMPIPTTMPFSSPLPSPPMGLNPRSPLLLVWSSGRRWSRCVRASGSKRREDIAILGEDSGLVRWAYAQQRWTTIALRQLLCERGDPPSALRARVLRCCPERVLLRAHGREGTHPHI